MGSGGNDLTINFWWQKKRYRPQDELAFSVSVTNPFDYPLEGAEIRLLLEIEKGVFYTWRISLKPIPPKGITEDAVASVLPHRKLYENIVSGRGTVYLDLFDAQGRLLWQDQDEIEITT